MMTFFGKRKIGLGNRRIVATHPHRFSQSVHTLARALLIGAIAGGLGVLLFCLPALPVTLAQLPIASPSTAQEFSNPPAGVERYGDIEVAAVNFEGYDLFKVVMPTVRDRSHPGNQTPVELRAEQIKANLRRIIATDQPEAPTDTEKPRAYLTTFDPKTLQVFPAKLQGETVLVANDQHRSQPLRMVTVTSADADYYGLTIPELTIRWQEILQERLQKALRDRLPEQRDQTIQQSVLIGLVTLAFSLVLWLLQRLLQRRDHYLKKQQAAETEKQTATLQDAVTTAETESPTAIASYRIDFLNTLRQQFSLQRRRRLLAGLKWLVGWGQSANWVLGISLILQKFPYTRQWGLNLLGIPITLLLVWLSIVILDWISDLLILHFSRAWEDDQFSAAFQPFGIGDAQRRSLRATTAVSVLKGLKTFLLLCLGVALVLQSLGVPVSSVLAGSALIAFGLSLGFQNLIKDLVNGCLILWEDQYGIGDVVSISGSTGLVENVNLRATQLRDAEGRLITLPNSTIMKVENLTRTWSRVNFEIEIAYDADVDRAIAVIDSVAQQLYAEPDWHNLILEAPQVLGVDRLSHSGIVISLWIKTQPGQQMPVGREFRRRLHRVLGTHHIAIGSPQQTFHYENGWLPPTPAPPPHTPPPNSGSSPAQHSP